MELGDEDLDCDNDYVFKMSCIFSFYLNKIVNGDCCKDFWEWSCSFIECVVVFIMSLYGSYLYMFFFSFGLEQFFVLIKNSLDVSRLVGFLFILILGEWQQNWFFVIICVLVGVCNCNFLYCFIVYSGCVVFGFVSYWRLLSVIIICDFVVEEYFCRSLGKNYKEFELVFNFVFIMGFVDDYFVKVLGDMWFQIKVVKDGVFSSFEFVFCRGQFVSFFVYMVSYSYFFFVVF